jgi:uncharacterized protein related to proFAR isomerase
VQFYGSLAAIKDLNGLHKHLLDTRVRNLPCCDRDLKLKSNSVISSEILRNIGLDVR